MEEGKRGDLNHSRPKGLVGFSGAQAVRKSQANVRTALTTRLVVQRGELFKTLRVHRSPIAVLARRREDGSKIG